ncbi:MAG: DUF3459 domain-containing protein [Planctomycetes bacterium]|nr:DUF3459 domain-containing protein [Planctomycetota bacterium]
MESSGINRRINRQQLQLQDIEDELAQDDSRRSLVFHAYKRLLHIRKQQPAFHPNAEQEVLPSPAGVFVLRRWLEDGQQIIAAISVSHESQHIDVSAFGTSMVDVLDNSDCDSKNIELAPYQIRWLVQS